MLQKERVGGAHRIPDLVLAKNDIKFIAMNAGDEIEF